MTNETVKHKVNVFISSRCGGKYEIARKALEKLLNETGLVQCYCFETEPGCSMSMPSAYMDQIPLHQLLLLIVDNEDDISDATMAEYKTAKELGLHIIAVFCNETKKEKTEIENEIIKTGLCKFVTASKFSDVVDLSYKTVIQDIVTNYMVKPTVSTDISVAETVKEIAPTTNLKVEKKFFEEFELTQSTILDTFYKSHSEKTTPSEEDILFQKILQVILCNTSFDESTLNKAKAVVIDKHSNDLKDIIAERLDAVKLYFLGKIDDCVSKLKEISEKLKSSSSVPIWFFNDVAIDLRNMINLQDSLKGIISIDNKGQAILDKSDEYVYFPTIDRIANDIKQNIIKEYSKFNLQSPYTNTLGGLDSVFTNVSAYFCVAFLYGSITHMRITREYLTEILEVLSQEYSNREFHSEFIRFLILRADDKKLKDVLRTYNRSTDIVSSAELTKIIESIAYLPTEYDRTHSTLLLLKYFGYYLTDEQFAVQLEWLLKYTRKWMKEKRLIFAFNDTIKSVFQSCCERIPSNKIAEFIISLFNFKNYRLYDTACELIPFLKIKTLPVNIQRRIATHLVKLVTNKKACENTFKLKNAIVIFALNTTIDITLLENAVKMNMETFYDGVYHLEVYDKDKKSSLKQINTYIQNIKSRISVQGKNGCYSSFMGNPFETIGNIITINKIKLDWTDVESIAETTTEFILSPNQSCGEKRQAITLLTTLLLAYPKMTELSGYISKNINKRDEILKVVSLDIFDTTNITTLTVALDCLGLLIGNISTVEVISSLSSISSMGDRDIIACMQYLSKSLEKTNLKNLPLEIIASILQLSVSLFGNKERDIRYLSVKCLIELTHSKYKELALKQLSLCMDSGTSDIRLAIVSGIQKIKDKSSAKAYIIQKAKVDNHYVIREIARELNEV